MLTGFGLGLGGEERIVDAVEVIAGDSGTGVLDASSSASRTPVSRRRVELGRPCLASFALRIRLSPTQSSRSATIGSNTIARLAGR